MRMTMPSGYHLVYSLLTVGPEPKASSDQKLIEVER